MAHAEPQSLNADELAAPRKKKAGWPKGVPRKGYKANAQKRIRKGAKRKAPKPVTTTPSRRKKSAAFNEALRGARFAIFSDGVVAIQAPKCQGELSHNEAVSLRQFLNAALSAKRT